MPPRLAAILSQVKAYKPPGEAQGNIKALLERYLETEDQSDRRELTLCLREDLPPNVLYSIEALSGPHQLYRNLRDYLLTLGSEYRQHQSNNRILYGLPAMLYTDIEEIDIAMANIAKWQNGDSANTSSHSNERVQQNNGQYSDSFHSNSQSEDAKLAHSIATRYKHDDKFGGSIDEDILEFITGYEEMAADYQMSEVQKRNLFHNVFRDDPKRFYRSFFAASTTYETAKEKMKSEYGGLVRQNRIRKHLQGLRLQYIISQKQCSVGDALSSLRETISKLAPQGPEAHRSEEAKVEYLYKSVVGASWARPALSQVYSAQVPWSFQQLYTALDAAWLQEQEETEGRQRDLPETSNGTAAMLYAGQGMYAFPRKKGSKSSLPYRHQKDVTNRSNIPSNHQYGRNGADKFGNPRRCNNCQSKDHLMRQCNNRRNLLHSVSKMVQRNPQDTQRILFEVCRQTEDALFSDTDSSESLSAEQDNENTSNIDAGADRAAPAETFYELISKVAHVDKNNNFQDPEDF